MGVDAGVVAGLAVKFAELLPHLDERGRRLYLGSEARALAASSGCSLASASAAVAGAAGASRVTVMAGAGELAGGAESMPGRSRRPGAGRKRAEDAQPGLRQALLGLLEESTRGDPVAEVTWCSQSLRELERRMAALGFACKKDAIARMMRAEGYSLQGMAKVLEGRQHPDRDAQFRHVNARIAAFRAAGDPVVSADAKKKELIGPYCRDGRSWRPAGAPVRVRDHDFPDAKLGRAAPYGIYDIAANTGLVVVGTSHDTAAFAVASIRRWWLDEGSLRYPGARRLLVACDAGGSNGYRCHLWKDQLALLAAETGLTIEVCHFPPGTSKWNKIEHRLFCHVTRTWRARPLMTLADAVAGIAATTTSQGLKCTAVLDDGDYPEGVKAGGERVAWLEERLIQRAPFHGEWNYALLPSPRPAPPPVPAPAPEHPGRCPRDLLACPALTGITPGDLHNLARTLDVPFGALREQRYYTRRGGRRTTAARATAPHGGLRLDLTDHLLALRLRQHAAMPATLIALLLGVHPATVTHATTLAWTLITQQGITLPAPAAPPPATPILSPADLTAYAEANDIALVIPGTPATQKWPKYAKRWQPPPATRPRPPT